VLNSIKYIYFLGIGGIGMSALARYFNAMGKSVAGYDKTSTKLTDELIAEGINIHFEDDFKLIPSNIQHPSSDILVVYTPAVPSDHSEYIYFKKNGFEIKKRAEVLGMITEATKTIAVAGTHGKTTTSSLVAHVLKTANMNPSAFLGGITKNYNTNLLLSENLHNSQLSTPNSQLTVVEADEYDRSFLTLYPETAVITSVDADHLDIYGNEKYMLESYELFSSQVKTNLILKNSVAEKIKVEKKYISYSLNNSSNNFYAKNIKIINGSYHYDIVTPKGVIENLVLGLPGKHNVENSIAACAVAYTLMISDNDIRKAFETFGGVKRRFDYHIKKDDLVFIDDYAHHPEELKATISSAKEMYPDKKITGIFQPHLFSRTRDFMDEFAKSLDLLDDCILLDIYPAREKPIEGITSSLLLSKMKMNNKKLCTKNNLVEEIKNKKPQVLLMMGAGDIDLLIEPIKEALLN